MHHHLISLDDPDNWQKALIGIKHSFSHTWEHCYAMYLTTGDNTFLYKFEKDGIRMVCPIIEWEFEGYTDIVKPFGFSGFVGTGKHPEFAKHWKEFAADRGYVTGYPGLSPVYDFSDLFDPIEVFQNNNVFVMDLQPSVQMILRGMSRRRAGRLKNNGHVTDQFVLNRSELEVFFLENYYDFLDRVGAKHYYYLSPETISYLFTLENVFIVGAKQDGNIVSAYFFGYTKHIATSLYVVSLPEGRQHSVPIIWCAAKELKRRGIPYLNLGGASGSLAEFKRRFGTQKKQLLCIKQIYRQDIYVELCSRANTDPNDIEGFFPPYRNL